jgi:hypothetical protein
MMMVMIMMMMMVMMMMRTRRRRRELCQGCTAGCSALGSTGQQHCQDPPPPRGVAVQQQARGTAVQQYSSRPEVQRYSSTAAGQRYSGTAAGQRYQLCCERWREEDVVVVRSCGGGGGGGECGSCSRLWSVWWEVHRDHVVELDSSVSPGGRAPRGKGPAACWLTWRRVAGWVPGAA